ncbi:putative RNA-binding protein [Ordospora pajunii]|uniref:putative RNA-binding protein n=1 Tax=Ordospora pajunii TaxID=3039483 RepID=UPI0029526BB0|nr:putative RNA-binding protein [Ordospora pajunii]KAH9412263.1 putative RNA-binding protein [Ordospora pajunii]
MGRSAVPSLAKLLHKRVAIKMSNGVVLEGVIIGYDAYMNAVLSDVSEPEGIPFTVVVRGEFVESIVPVDKNE